MKKILMTRLSVCSLGVSCNEMIDTLMLLVVPLPPPRQYANAITIVFIEYSGL